MSRDDFIAHVVEGCTPTRHEPELDGDEEEHAAWSFAMRERGYHGPREVCTSRMCGAGVYRCQFMHEALVRWGELPEAHRAGLALARRAA